MREVDVIIPTKKGPQYQTAVSSTRHIPFPFKLHTITDGDSWPEAINIGFNESTGDVLLMDDDIVLLKDTFKPMLDLFDKADIFGFKLIFPDGRIQHAGGFIAGTQMGHIGHGEEDKGQYDGPLYVAHCTASLLYIKRPVIEKLVKMYKMMGVQFEDVEFSCRALKAGFKIMYTPGKAIHGESVTKKRDPFFADMMGANYMAVRHTHLDDEGFQKVLSGYPHV